MLMPEQKDAFLKDGRAKVHWAGGGRAVVYGERSIEDHLDVLQGFCDWARANQRAAITRSDAGLDTYARPSDWQWLINEYIEDMDFLETTRDTRQALVPAA